MVLILGADHYTANVTCLYWYSYQIGRLHVRNNDYPDVVCITY